MAPDLLVALSAWLIRVTLAECAGPGHCRVRGRLVFRGDGACGCLFVPVSVGEVLPVNVFPPGGGRIIDGARRWCRWRS
ncbi:MAG: hypothetical protein JO287_07865 [Pseudonocardiales bacterium]|nr:hypothetical protein [Pseudonocardiales bacterium]